MKFRPLHDRVVVRRLEGEEKTKGGIIIPDTAKEKPQEGEIIAVGPGGRDEAGKLTPLDVKKGDKVLFGKWPGTEVKINGQDLLIMKESDIMAVAGGSRRFLNISSLQPRFGSGVFEPWLPKKCVFPLTPARKCCVASTSSP